MLVYALDHSRATIDSLLIGGGVRICRAGEIFSCSSPPVVGADGMMIVTIGRKGDCDIVLNAETISRRHAELGVLGEGRFLLHDTESTGGTFIQEDRGWRRVTRATVIAGDVVKFGDLQMTVSELLAKLATPLQAGDMIEVARKKVPGSRFERDPETGLIKEKRCHGESRRKAH